MCGPGTACPHEVTAALLRNRHGESHRTKTHWAVSEDSACGGTPEQEK